MEWSDQEFKLLRQGDKDIFEKLYVTYKKRVYNFLMLKTQGNQEIANEVFSETFHSALVSVSRLKNRDNIGAWLVQIAFRRLQDYFRKKYRNDNLQTQLKERPDTKDEIFEELQKKEELLLLKLAMDNIKPKQKQLLQLKYEANKSQKDIARELGKSEGAVEQLLFRARDALKREYLLLEGQ